MTARSIPSSRPTPVSRTQPVVALGVRHDRRAWLVFVLLAVLLVAVTPMAGRASAQVPGVPGLPGGEADPEGGDPDGQGDPDDRDPEEGGPGEGEPAEEPDGEGDPDEGPGAPGLPAGGEHALKTAYYTAPTSEALPRTLITEFPPGVVCILFPDACTEDAAQLTGPLEEVLLQGIDGVDVASADAQQPVVPGTLPVGVLSGSQRYTAALGIPLPAVGEHQSFGELLVTVTMTDYALALESPAFRELVNAALIQATDQAGPQPFEALLAGLASGDVAPATTDFAGLEMCVIKTPWEAGPSQPSEVQPAIDPLFCSPVAWPAEDGTVTFDMTFPANDSLPGGFTPGWEGVLVRVLGSQNLAFGDPDYSTNYIAYLDNPDAFPPAVAATVIDDPPPPPPLDSGSGGSGGGAGVSGSSGGSGGGGSGRGTGSSGPRGGAASSSPAGAAGPGPGGGEPAAGVGTDVAADGAMDATTLPTDGAAPLLDAAPVDIASSGWIPWVLLPMVLGGALWYGRVLDVAPVEQVVRAGAMTRLLQQRGFPL